MVDVAMAIEGKATGGRMAMDHFGWLLCFVCCVLCVVVVCNFIS